MSYLRDSSPSVRKATPHWDVEDHHSVRFAPQARGLARQVHAGQDPKGGPLGANPWGEGPENLFQGNALLRSTSKFWTESSMMFDYMLGLKTNDFLQRRLQTQMFKLGLDKYNHLARVLIRQRSEAHRLLKLPFSGASSSPSLGEILQHWSPKFPRGEWDHLCSNRSKLTPLNM